MRASVRLTLGVIGLIGVIVCCVLPCWRVTTYIGTNIVTVQTVLEGLWMSCVVQSTGQQQCKYYDPLLVLPSDLQAARAMTITSCLLACLSLLILFCGADFTTCVENEEVKPKIRMVAGVGLILAGLLVIIPVSWSALLLDNSQKRELGVCIYVGWVAGALLFLSGGLMCCFSRSKSEGPGGTTTYYTTVYYSVSAPTKTQG